jgi:tetratricopeptide (TPR) repeat protein
MNRQKQGARPAMTRYTAVSQRVIEKLRADYWAGLPLGQRIPGLDEVAAAIIVQDSLRADQLVMKPLEELLDSDLKGLSDWELAVEAEFLFFVAASGTKQAKNIPPELSRLLETRAWAALEAALDSPTASPMLWYGDMFFDVAQEYRLRGNRRAIDLLKRALAHDLRFDEGKNAAGMLRDLAEAHVELGDSDLGIGLFAQVLRNYPADIWTYNELAFLLDSPDLAELAIEATAKGLALIEATGDPEKLEEQLLEQLERLQANRQPGSTVKLDPNVLGEMRAALAMDFDAGSGLSAEELCRKLVPDLDRVPVKKPPQMPTLPPASAQSAPPLITPGRNDPCWCGSGRKYKRCHLRTDRQMR